MSRYDCQIGYFYARLICISCFARCFWHFDRFRWFIFIEDVMGKFISRKHFLGNETEKMENWKTEERRLKWTFEGYHVLGFKIVNPKKGHIIEWKLSATESAMKVFAWTCHRLSFKGLLQVDFPTQKGLFFYEIIHPVLRWLLKILFLSYSTHFNGSDFRTKNAVKDERYFF